MKKKFFLATGAFLAACTMVPSFTSCDKETRSEILDAIWNDSIKTEIIDNLIDQAIGYISRDSTDYLAGTWVSVDERNGIYDTLRFGKMTATPATYETVRLGYSGTYSEHYVQKDSVDYIDKGVYSYIKSMKEVLIYTPKSYIYMYDGQKYPGTEVEDGSIYEYAAQVMKLNLTSDYSMHQLTLTEYENGKEVGATQYTYVDETK